MRHVVSQNDTQRQTAAVGDRDPTLFSSLLTGRASYVIWGALVVLLVSALELAFHLNHPQPYQHWDTPSFLDDAHSIMDTGNVVSPLRVPGYPLLMALVFMVAGRDNFAALYVVQQALFVLASLELFVLVALIARKAYIAGAVALLFGLDVGPLAYTNLLVAEGLSLFFFVTLALCIVWFVVAPSRWSLWLVTAATLALAMTRPEFIYLPIPLFAYLGWLVWRRGLLRTYVGHLVGALVALYAVIGLYIHQNAVVNHYSGISFVQNINLLGKVMQYHMTGADPQYAATDQLVRSSLAQGIWNPFDLFPTHPELSADYWKLCGDYATSVIEHHPAQFVLHTIPLVFNPPIAWAIAFIQEGQPFASLLNALQQIAVYIEGLLIYAPLFALAWVALLLWRPTSRNRLVEAMGAMALLLVFDRVMTVVGSYSDYIRLQSTCAPLATLLTLGSFFLLIPVVLQLRSSRGDTQKNVAIRAAEALSLATASPDGRASVDPAALAVANGANGSASAGLARPASRVSQGDERARVAPVGDPSVGQGRGMSTQEGSSGKSVVIMGAGPAGLTAGYELMRYQVPVLVLEKDPQYVGGISRTVEHHGYRFDIGGHRFFSKSQEVEDFWTEILGPEMLTRGRLSRILYKGKYFDYPLKAGNALLNMGPIETVRCMSSYAWARIHPVRNPKNLEEWVSNQFGHRLFSIFFKTYTEKVWGMSTKELSADWAAQRIKGLDLSKAIKSALLPERKKGKKGAGKDRKAVITTLIDEFRYPRLGPGEMWERVRDKLREGGNVVAMGQEVVAIRHTPGQGVRSIVARDADGREHEVQASHFISTLPIRELIAKCEPALPPEVQHAANSLNYRDFLTIAVVINKPNMFPDNWIYLHDPSVIMGRIQNFKNWSPEMVADPNTTCLGLEYFCFEGDGLWDSTDEQLVELARRELAMLKLCKPEELLWGVVVRQPKAYPVYDDVYKQHLAVIKDYVERELPNLQLVGRNGMHHYNNQDHSMMTALLAARNIALGTSYDPWKVNTDAEYHEEARLEDKSGRQVPKRVPTLAQVEK